jgi:predicted dienelactone hydrolase
LDVPGTLGETRPIQVHVWYPARDRDECDEATNSAGGFGECHAPLAVYTSRLWGVPLATERSKELGLPDWRTLAWTTAGNAFEDARGAEGDDRFPVIIFSHGGGNNAIDYGYTLEELASHGYVVVAPDHVRDTQDDARIDFLNGEVTGILGEALQPPLFPCVNGLSPPCLRNDLPTVMLDRFNDVEAVLDHLQAWFGERVDLDRVGMMGHSRGAATGLALAGGSRATSGWGFQADPKRRIKAVMGLALGGQFVVDGIDLGNVRAPVLLVAGSLDQLAPEYIGTGALSHLGSTDEQFVPIQNAVHRHYGSTLCARMQSAGAIAQANPLAVLDLQTVTGLVQPAGPANMRGVTLDNCGYDSFTKPTDITSFVKSITNPHFQVLPTDVPRTGLTTDAVKDEVVSRAVNFFGRVLNRADDDHRPFKECLSDEVKKQP